ncbi:lipocalin family protein [Galbibacter sp. BG1]|uniref:lipocalin family protein n=1 Tax=Galbibacter sp. BG1 TaxID=1170699 RepID=UPI0015C061A4|nr:lipocalin family protein [Galbibacter sp. BG1]QLE02920.1 lipocalin family protein [Galbibacter sp. BG1]
MKTLLIIACCFFFLTVNAQADKEIVGKWKLVKFTKPSGKEKAIKKEFGSGEVYQIFEANHDFKSTIGNKEYSGTWKIVKNGQELQIDTGSGPLKFKLVYMDAEKRTISNGMLGTLDYVKVE